jgi:hypothetical protein
MLKELLENGADIEAKDNGGCMPLHWAIFEGHLAIVKALMSGGTNILATNNEGDLPIHYTVREGCSAGASISCSSCTQQPVVSGPLHELVEDLAWIGNLVVFCHFVLRFTCPGHG